MGGLGSPNLLRHCRCPHGTRAAERTSGSLVGFSCEHAEVALDPDYVALQVAFAASCSRFDAVPFSAAALVVTNLHRRLGMGTPDSDHPSAAWQSLADRLDGLDSTADRVACIVEIADRPHPSSYRTSAFHSGPFSIEIRGSIARPHFVPHDDGDGLSPLHPSKLGRRRRDLQSVVAAARCAHPEIERLRGGSWLYNSTSYRSLFPAPYVATATTRTDVFRFQGSSHWGQFLDHRGATKPDLAREFLRRLDVWDGTAPWLLFPLPTLEVEAPISAFEEPW